MTDAVQLQRRLRVALQNDDYEAAVACLTEAVELAHAAGDQAAEGRHLGNLALLYNRLGKPEDALRCFEQALALVRAEGDRITEDGLLGNMGNILREMGRRDEARDYLNAALEIAQEIGDVRGRGIWLSNLGLVYDDLKQPERAIEYHSQSVMVARQLFDQRGLAARLRKLSDSFMAAGKAVEALQSLGEAQAIYTALGDQPELLAGFMAGARIYSTLARVAAAPDEVRAFNQGALDYYRYGLELARAEGNTMTEAQILAHMGETLIALGSGAEGLECLQTAWQMAGQLGLAQWQETIAQYLEQLAAREPKTE